MRSFHIAAFLLLSTLATTPAPAQTPYPARAIHIIVPFPAGGPSDVLARLIGDRMSVDFQQPVVVENRPGANTVIGAEAAAKASPDGYTLLMAIDSTLVMNQYLYKTLPYDPIADFAPISLVAKTIGLLVVNAQSDYKSVKDLVAKAKAAPGKLNYGAGTISTKLQGYLFNDAAGVDTLLVPYNGSSEVAHGILTKSVDFVFDGPSAELPLIQSGDLRALAKLDARAFPALPDLPTLDAAAGPASRQSHGLARARGAARHAGGRHRQAARRDRENPQRSRHQGAGRRGRALSVVQHARGIRRIHQDRGGALAAGGEEKRSAFRLKHAPQKGRASLHIPP